MKKLVATLMTTLLVMASFFGAAYAEEAAQQAKNVNEEIAAACLKESEGADDPEAYVKQCISDMQEDANEKS